MYTLFRLALVLYSPSICLSIRIVEPADGSHVHSHRSTVSFLIEADSHDLQSQPQACVQLTNKRLTYESYVHCVNPSESGRTSFELSGVEPGVWRCRAFLRQREATHSYSSRGAIRGVLADDISWFVVDKDRWFTPPSQNLQVLALARKAGNSERWLKLAGEERRLVVSVANSPHVDLALNMIYSARRAGLPPAVVFALSAEAEERLNAYGVETFFIKPNLSISGDLDAHRDVQSKGFGAIAAMKAVAVLTILHAGIDAYWADTDVVFFDRFDWPHGFDFVFQSGGLGPLDVARGEDHFHVEACTGLYVAKANRSLVVDALEAVVNELHYAQKQGIDWFGDQAATNLVLFEQRFRTGESQESRGSSVGLLDPLLAPGGGLFFQRDASLRTTAKLAHNNFIIGKTAKLERFKKTGLWFNLSQPRHFEREFFGKSKTCRLELLGERWPLHDFVPEHGVHSSHSCEPAKVAIATVSVGDRPWFSAHVAPRLAAYARRIGADLIIRKRGCEEDACAKRQKLQLANNLLFVYSRVLLVDDTVAIRNDAPELFKLVPPLAIGATVEDARVRPYEESAALLALSRMSYDPTVSYDDLESSGSLWFNSGVLVLSWLHASLFKHIPPQLDDMSLYWDQVWMFCFLRFARHQQTNRLTSTRCEQDLNFLSWTWATHLIMLVPSKRPTGARYVRTNICKVDA